MSDKISEEEDDGGEKPRIKVTDRRKFAADGTPLDRQDSPALDEAEAPADAEPQPAAEGDGESDSAPTTAAEGDAEASEVDDDAPRIASPSPSMADLPRDFSAFVESLYFEAMLYLGAIADPRTGQVHEDVELAKYKIDILGMLQEKTEGNRTAEESRQLDEVLYQLRMVYLQKSKTVDL